jgi:tetratricopeptide (TPR) repeat protein
MTMIYPALSIYTQDRLSDRAFVDNFVARLDLLEHLLNNLRNHIDGKHDEHHLIIGQRGMGKSTLLRRVAIGIISDGGLSRHLAPLRFREEQYNVTSLDAFWRNCGEALAEWCEAHDYPQLAEHLDAVIDGEDWLNDEKALTGLLSVCTELRRRPVLLVDNIDLIINALRSSEQWSLRRALQMQGGPVVIGAATHFLDQSGSREAPFYEFFLPHMLDPLSERELLHCMNALADSRKEAGTPVKEILAREPERLRTLYALTGGNPRVLALIYQLLERSESDTIFADLEGLLDQVTPFYKARVEEYQSGQQRAVIDAIALNWDPITSHNLSDATNIEVTTISSHLNRLKRDGFVQEVSTSGARSGYQIAERFLNIWYLMRHGTRRTRQKLRWLTIFLSKLYSAEELRKMASKARGDLSPCAWNAEYREAVIAAYEEIENAASGNSVSGLDTSHVGLKILVEEQGTSRHDVSPASSAIFERLSAASKSFDSAIDMMERGEFRDALSIIDQSIASLRAADGIPALSIALFIVSRGIVLGQIGDAEAAIGSLNEALAEFDKSGSSDLSHIVAFALNYKAKCLADLSRFEEAIAASHDLLERLAASNDHKLNVEVARALIFKGQGLLRLDRLDESVSTFHQVVNRFGMSKDSELQIEVARAMARIATALRAHEKHEDVLVVVAELLARFGSSEEPYIRAEVADALGVKATSLSALERTEEATKVFDEALSVIRLIPERLSLLFSILLRKAAALGRMRRYEDAIAVCDEIDERFSENSAFLEGWVKAWTFKAVVLNELGQREEALATYQDILTRLAAANGAELVSTLPRVFMGHASTLEILGRFQEAVSSYDEVLGRFGAVADVRELVVEALIKRGNIYFDRIGNLALAENSYRLALETSPRSDLSRGNLAWLLLSTGRRSEAARLRADVKTLQPTGHALLDAGLQLANDNFGVAVSYVGEALEAGVQREGFAFFDDLLRLLRLAEVRGYGEKLLQWFKATGNAERYAPLYAAFEAYVRGERFLLDVNPETRRPAREIYEELSAPRSATPSPGKRVRAVRAKRRR